MRTFNYYHLASGSFIRRSVMEDPYQPAPGDWIEGAVDPDTQYVSGGALAARTTETLTSSKTLIADNGVDSAVITCPNPCWLRINGAFVQANGSYTLTATTAGIATIRLAGRHVGPELIVTIGDDLDMAFANDPRWIALKSATSAQIDTWLTSNVTNIAQARTVLKVLLLAIRRINR